MLRDVRRSGLVHLLGYQRYLRLELCELNLINMNGNGREKLSLVRRLHGSTRYN